MGFATELLASLGGATLLLGGFSTFLGKVWADRIAKQTVHKFELELESIRSASVVALEQVRTLNQLLVEERQSFNHISQKTYQEFFEKRLETYKAILAVRHDYLSEVGEDFLVDEVEIWGDAYVRHYNALKKIVGENQMFLSAKLDDAFKELRKEYSGILKDNDRELAYLHGDERQSERSSELNNELLSATSSLYEGFVRQLEVDVKSLRSRIDLDKV